MPFFILANHDIMCSNWFWSDIFFTWLCSRSLWFIDFLYDLCLVVLWSLAVYWFSIWGCVAYLFVSLPVVVQKAFRMFENLFFLLKNACNLVLHYGWSLLDNPVLIFLLCKLFRINFLSEWSLIKLDFIGTMIFFVHLSLCAWSRT